MRSCTVLAALVLSATVSAQGAVPPFKSSVLNPQPGLSWPAIPGTNIQQVHMIHLPGDPPNVFLVGATCAGLQATFGGVGGSDVVSGKYDVLTDTFTPNAEAGALNTVGTEFGLMLHHTGLYAVFDRLPGLPYLASRTAVGQPWQVVGQISPLPSQPYYDPALADYNGQPHLLHVLGTSIAMTPINLSNGQLIGPSVTIALAARSGATSNSPTPVVDSVGELIGISHHDVLGSDNDHYMSLDLDPTTPAILLHDTTGWNNNGAFVGGRFFDAEYQPAPYHILSIDAVWFTGGRGPIGGTMDVFAYVPPTVSSEIFLSFMFIAPGFLPAGQPVPPLLGLLGIPAALVTVPFPQHLNQNGTAQITLGIPNVNSLRNTRLPAQSATYAVSGGTLTLGNTAVLTIQ